MQARTSTFGEVFYSGLILEIPFFQRSYVWKEELWERCLRDVQAALRLQQPHFMGCLLFKKAVADTGETHLTVIDGQQRLTTILLLLKAFADRWGASPDLFRRFRTPDGEPIFIHNHMDREVFDEIFYESSGELPDIERYGGVEQCYRYFTARADEEEIAGIGQLMDFVYFVAITLEEGDDEQEIFETINSLGTDLTTGELLKNELFNRGEMQYYFDTWGKAFEHGDRRKYWELKEIFKDQILNVFLKSYYYLAVGVPAGFEPQGSMFKKYQQYLNTHNTREERHGLIDDLVDTADIFRKTFDHVLLDNPFDRIRPLRRLVLVILAQKWTNIIPYVLFVLKRAESAEQDRIFALLEAYIMRRMVCNLSPVKYHQLFNQLIREEILTYDALLAKLKIGTDDSCRMPSPKDVYQAIWCCSRKIPDSQLKLVFYLLEASARCDKPWRPLNGFKEYLIQELYPIKEDKWYQDNLDDIEKKYLEHSLKLIGNFVLAGSRVSARKTWMDRRDALTEKCEGIFTAEDCLSKADWNYQEIYDRSCRMAGRMLRIWQCDFDAPFTLPADSNVPEYIARAEENRDIGALGQIMNQCQDRDLKAQVAAAHLRLVEQIMDSDYTTDDLVPHQLNGSFAGTRPYKWVWKGIEHSCSSWGQLFYDLAKTLYNQFPEKMQNFCRFGGDKYICSQRRELDGGWETLGANCYIYTHNIGTETMQKSILNMLQALQVDITEFHVYRRGRTRRKGR